MKRLEVRQRVSETKKGFIPWNKDKIDIYTPETISKIKEARLRQVIPIKDTSIEVILQNFLKELNIPFEKHKAIIGQPDLFIEPNICIFADGCYWHGCEICYDKNKFNHMQQKARVRDILVTEKLKQRGYIVLRLWEHHIKGSYLNKKAFIAYIAK